MEENLMGYHGTLIVELILEITLMQQITGLDFELKSQQNGRISYDILIFSHTPKNAFNRFNDYDVLPLVRPTRSKSKLNCSKSVGTSAFCVREVLLKRLADFCSSAAGYNL
jgi:hypothetical protein